LTRGFCFRCGREIGSIFKPTAWRCYTCQHLYCERCAKDRVGFLFKKPACPECGIELHEG